MELTLNDAERAAVDAAAAEERRALGSGAATAQCSSWPTRGWWPPRWAAA